VLVPWVGPDDRGVLFNTLLASDRHRNPGRNRCAAVVEGAINRWMFQEKYELTRRMNTLRADLANIIYMARHRCRSVLSARRIPAASRTPLYTWS